MKEKICHIDMKNVSACSVVDKVRGVWGKHDIYHIFNMSEHDYRVTYENLAQALGSIRLCHPVNNKNTKFSNSRDIKYDPNIPHFFASNTRQPLHTDYAYYESAESPDWLMLYCLKPSKYGGTTDILTLDTLKEVMRTYNPKLLKDIEIDIVWSYNGLDGDKIHTKPILDNDKINWNYWQIKKDLNSDSAMKIREEFFRFLEEIITEARIYDFSKKWQSGDCVIFRDSTNLHGRSAFLGDRWLKDHAFYENKRKQNEN
jgi:alpha-ketoglutarate-dependent taurine dioxygenase